MANTFGQAWRAVRNHCPLAPASLVQYWVQSAYDDICRKRPWSWLRAESQILISDSKSGTCNVTGGSTSVSGGTLSYATSDAGRQFRVGTGPIYTISAATVVGYTLDRVYGGSDATATTATVLDAYVTMPTDFRRFVAVIDVENAFQLRHFVTEDELNRWDPQRSSTGTPWAVVSRRTSTLTSTLSQVQYEVWPYATSKKTYPYYYIKNPAAFTTDDDTLPLGIDYQILIDLALVQASLWPGTEDKRNPFFNLELAAFRKRQADDALARMEVLDEEIFNTWLETVSWIRLPWSPLDSKFLQNHDAYGMAWPA